MSHVKALVIKFIMIAVILGITLTGIYGGELNDTLLISAVLTITAYILGDLLIFKSLPFSQLKQNVVATVSDTILAFFVIWFMGNALFTASVDVLTASFVSALAIGAGEWFFHLYLDKNVFNRKRPLTK